MCGIAVIVPGSALTRTPFTADRMAAALAHRGPDAQESLSLPGCELAHARLSIIDIAGGRQPMTDPTGRFTLVFNGEIFNHRDLRLELQREGLSFSTQSDTEVLLLGLVRFGAAFVPRLNGQFAFALWDSQLRTLFAARDRFGEKPLYWAVSPAGDLIMASEIKAILASGRIAPRIDRLSVDAYLGLFYVPPDRTIYENVHTVPPAHRLTWSPLGAARLERYWSPRLSYLDVDEEEVTRQISTLVSKAVERQMIADVPIGAFLSGGLDSSTIVAEMARLSRRPVKTFAAGFGDLIDELPHAREVAAYCGTDAHELQMDIDVAAQLQTMNAVYDEPLGDSSNIPTFLLCQYARRHVTVALSGDGGDEIFGGYEWYRTLLCPDAASDMDGWARHVGGATGLLFDRAALWGSAPQPPAARAVRDRHAAVACSTLDRATQFDLSCYLPGDILVKVDRAAMAHGLEVRAPFLDVELADFVLGLPWQMRFGQGPPSGADPGGAGPGLKRLLRRACGHLWPQRIGSRPKQGFGAPVRQWIEQPAVAHMLRRVMSPTSALVSLLPGLPAAQGTLRPQRKWSLLCLGLWLERRSECLAALP